MPADLPRAAQPLLIHTRRLQLRPLQPGDADVPVEVRRDSRRAESGCALAWPWRRQGLLRERWNAGGEAADTACYRLLQRPWTAPRG